MPVQQSPARWPAPNPTMKGTGAATVGYKVRWDGGGRCCCGRGFSGRHDQLRLRLPICVVCATCPANPRHLPQGIQTDYLPSSTVPLKTVEGIPGCAAAPPCSGAGVTACPQPQLHCFRAGHPTASHSHTQPRLPACPHACLQLQGGRQLCGRAPLSRLRRIGVCGHAAEELWLGSQHQAAKPCSPLVEC